MICTKLLNRVTGITSIRGRHGIERNLKDHMLTLVKLIYMNAVRYLHASNLSNAIRYAKTLLKSHLASFIEGPWFRHIGPLPSYFAEVHVTS